MAAAPVNAVTEATPHGGLPQMQSDTFPSQIFWLVVTFGLLFLILWKITLPMIEGIIGERRNRIEGDLATAEKLRQQASESLAAYESELAGARGRAHQIMDENRKAIGTELDSVKTRADEESQAAMKQAEERIAADRTRALGSLRPAAAEAAAAIVERLIGTRVSAEEAARVISEQQAPA
jgi:F-type H+-transporting ATPase subunit b